MRYTISLLLLLTMALFWSGDPCCEGAPQKTVVKKTTTTTRTVVGPHVAAPQPHYAVKPYNGAVTSVKQVNTQVFPHGGTVTTVNKTTVTPVHNGTLVGGYRPPVVTAPGVKIVRPEGGVVGGYKPGVVVPGKGPVIGGHYPTDLGFHPSKTVIATGKHYTTYVPVKTLQAHGNYYRSHFKYYNTFTPTWYKSHPVAWRPLRWRPGGIWYRSTWPIISVWGGYPVQPIYYDYGSNVVYQNDTVYVQGDPVGSAADYANQALQISNLGRNVNLGNDEEWQPLGVFTMVQGQENDANLIVQLAINKRGILRGNFYNALTDSSLPIFGAVDPNTQRAAWTVGDKQNPVYETALANLTQDQATMLVHFGPESTQQWTLVRMQNNQPGP